MKTYAEGGHIKHFGTVRSAEDEQCQLTSEIR